MAADDQRRLAPRLRFPEFRDAPGWPLTTLGRLGNLIPGLTYSPDDVRDEGLLVLRSSNIRNGEVALDDNVYVVPEIKGANLSEPNDILICVRNGSKSLIGKNALIPKDMPRCTHGAFMTVLRAQTPRFVFQLLQTSAYQKQVAGDLGATINSINGSQLIRYQFFAPEAAEQQKIADCLTSLNELIGAQGRKVEALKAHKKGLMQQLFPREGETVPRLRFDEFRVAAEWQTRRFSDLLEEVLDFRGRTPKKLGMEWGSGEIISLSANNVKNGFIDYDAECYFGSEALYCRWMGTAKLEKNDIVFTMEAPFGNALLVPDSRKYILSQRVVAFKTKPTVVNEFLVQLIWGEGFQNAINLLATGSTAKGISQKALQRVEVVFPDEKEQQRIADCLFALDARIAAEADKLAALKTHKKGLMQQLFPDPHETISPRPAAGRGARGEGLK